MGVQESHKLILAFRGKEEEEGKRERGSGSLQIRHRAAPSLPSMCIMLLPSHSPPLPFFWDVSGLEGGEEEAHVPADLPADAEGDRPNFHIHII